MASGMMFYYSIDCLPTFDCIIGQCTLLDLEASYHEMYIRKPLSDRRPVYLQQSRVFKILSYRLKPSRYKDMVNGRNVSKAMLIISSTRQVDRKSR